MAAIFNTAEGGTSGTGVSTANSGGLSGTAFSAVVGATTFSNAQAAHGVLSYRMVNASTAGMALVLALPGGATKYAARTYVRFATLPPTFTYLIAPQGPSGAKFRVNTGNTFAIADQNGTIKATFPTAFTTGVWYRLEIEVEWFTFGAATGTIAGRYFIGDATTPVDTAYAGSGLLTMAAAPSGVQFGPSTVIPNSPIDMYLDDLALTDGTITPIGPAVPAVAAFAGWGIPL